MHVNKYHSALTVIVLALSFLAVVRLPQQSLAKQLVGEWRNVYLKIKLNINDPKPVIMEADSSNWETRLKIQPIRTHFKADGSYYSEYRNLKDSVVRMSSGTWMVNAADTLVMNELKPEKSVLKLHLSINNNHATFAGVIDFNGDGKKDDDYFGIQKKYSN